MGRAWRIEYEGGLYHQVDPVDEQANAKTALTELFAEVKMAIRRWWSSGS